MGRIAPKGRGRGRPAAQARGTLEYGHLPQAVGYHNDSHGLYYVVKAKGASWCYRFQWEGKLKEMGLGSARAFGSSDEVRDERDRWQAVLVREKKNPIEERRRIEAEAKAFDGAQEKARKAQEEKAAQTFGFCALAFVTGLEGGWKNEKHRQQWRNTLATYCASIWDKPVSDVDTADVMACLLPIWVSKAETASRLRGRIERVLAYAKVKGYRSGDNPARWHEHLDHLLPKRRRGLSRGHHKAKPYEKVRDLIGELRAIDSIPALALEFTISVAKRTTEVRLMGFNEVDHARQVWTIPGQRMKGTNAAPHDEPLTKRQLEIVAEMAKLRTPQDLKEPNGGFVFKGRNKRGEFIERPISNGAMSMLLRRLGHDDATVHGFRSSFRDWTAEKTTFKREVAEFALSHKVTDETEGAYWRSKMVEQRRRLMNAWGAYIEPSKEGAKVIQIGRKAAS